MKADPSLEPDCSRKSGHTYWLLPSIKGICLVEVEKRGLSGQPIDFILASPTEMSEIQQLLLRSLADAGEIQDSVEFATKHDLDHTRLTGQALSLEASSLVQKEVCFYAIHA